MKSWSQPNYYYLDLELLFFTKFKTSTTMIIVAKSDKWKINDYNMKICGHKAVAMFFVLTWTFLEIPKRKDNYARIQPTTYSAIVDTATLSLFILIYLPRFRFSVLCNRTTSYFSSVLVNSIATQSYKQLVVSADY